MPLLEVDDLAPFATIDDGKAQEMVTDAIALATLSAPCLAGSDLTDLQVAQAKAVLRAAVLRWNDSGTGAVSAQAAGPFSETLDTRQPRRTMFWPSEISALQKICKGGTDGGVFSVDTAAPAPMQFHETFPNWSSDDGAYVTGAIAFDDDSNDGLFS